MLYPYTLNGRTCAHVQDENGFWTVMEVCTSGFCDGCQEEKQGKDLHYVEEIAYLYCENCVVGYLTNHDDCGWDDEMDETGRFYK